mgnify:CR=1 FL=1
MAKIVFILTGIVWIILVLYVGVVAYAVFIKVREWLRIQKIRKKAVATPHINGDVAAEKESTRNSLLGYLPSDIVLYGSNFIAAMAVLSSSALAWDTARINKIAHTEFQLRTRPYVIINNVEGNTDTTVKKSDFRVFIKNTGTMPAKITKQSMICGDDDRSSAADKNDVIGNNQSYIYEFQIIGIDAANCVLNIKYRSALESFSFVEYETQQAFKYVLGEKLHSGGGFMK